MWPWCHVDLRLIVASSLGLSRLEPADGKHERDFDHEQNRIEMQEVNIDR